MIAEGVRDTDLGAYQRAARTVLVHPLVTRTHPNADALAMVRRFAIPLARDLDAVAGYRLELSPTCARLVKRTDRLDPTQAIQLPQKKPFDRRRYAYLSLVLGALGRAAGELASLLVAVTSIGVIGRGAPCGAISIGVEWRSSNTPARATPTPIIR